MGIIRVFKGLVGLMGLSILLACGQMEPSKLSQDFSSTNEQVTSLSTFEGYDIIVVAGQSNAVGRGAIASNNVYDFGYSGLLSTYMSPSNSKVMQINRYPNQFGNGAIVIPLAKNKPPHFNLGPSVINASLGRFDVRDSVNPQIFLQRLHGTFTHHLATKVAQVISTNRKVLIIPVAKGATSVTDWLPGATYNSGDTSAKAQGSSNNLYYDMLYKVRQAMWQPGNHRFLGIIWQQGEADLRAMVDNGHPNYVGGSQLTMSDAMINSALNNYSNRVYSVLNNVRNNVVNLSQALNSDSNQANSVTLLTNSTGAVCVPVLIGELARNIEFNFPSSRSSINSNSSQYGTYEIVRDAFIDEQSAIADDFQSLDGCGRIITSNSLLTNGELIAQESIGNYPSITHSNRAAHVSFLETDRANDYVHFSAKALRTLGHRYFNAIDDLADF